MSAAAQHELSGIATPALVLEERRMLRNIQRLRAHLEPLGVPLRPHLKTAKSDEVARHLLANGTGPARGTARIRARGWVAQW